MGLDREKKENAAETTGRLYENECVSCRRIRAKSEVIGNTTGHVYGGKANFDPECTSPVRQIGLEISPRAPQG